MPAARRRFTAASITERLEPADRDLDQRVDVLNAEACTVDADIHQAIGEFRRDVARIKFDGVFEALVIEALVKGKPAAERRSDRSQAVGSENAGRAAAPMQPRDGGLLADKTGDELDLGLQRTAIVADHVVANRLLGVAAAIEAYLAAIGHMQIDRNAFFGIEPAEPGGVLVRPH
jgi:hypothetical protein